MGLCKSKRQEEEESDEDEGDGEYGEAEEEGVIYENEHDQCLKGFSRTRELLSNWTSTINIFLKLTNVGNPYDEFFIVVYWRKSDSPIWVYCKTTDVQLFEGAATPELTFATTVAIQFQVTELRFLRFEVYRVKDPDNLDDLRVQRFIGSCTTSLIEILLERGRSAGWLKLDLGHPAKLGESQGVLGAYAEEELFYKQKISFDLQGISLKSTDRWKAKPDAYCVVYREVKAQAEAATQVEPILRTKVHRKSGDPHFGRVSFTTSTGWLRGKERGLLLEIRDWFRVHRHSPVGEAWFDYNAIISNFQGAAPYKLDLFAKPSRNKHLPKVDCKFGRMLPSKKHRTAASEAYTYKVGALALSKIQIERVFTLLDYIRGGMELKLIVGIDLSRSGGMRDLHTRKSNTYLHAIRAAGEIMQKYDSDDKYPVYGLGATLPPSYSKSYDTFALSGDFFNPEVEGIEGICTAYKRALKIARMHGPTRLSTLVEYAVQATEPYAEANDANVELCFSVLLVLTDGDVIVQDRDPLIEAIISAAAHPLCIVFLGVGSSQSNIDFMRSIRRQVFATRQARGATPQELTFRHVVRFVELDNIQGDAVALEKRVREQAAEALSEIPREVLGFYQSKGTAPRSLEKFEKENGDPKPPPPNMYSKEELKKLRNEKKNMRLGSRTASRADSRTDSRMTSRDTRSASRTSNSSTSSHPTKVFGEKSAMDLLLAQQRDALKAHARKLGYHRPDIERALNLGCPANDIDALLDILSKMGIFGNATTYLTMLRDMDEDYENEENELGFEMSQNDSNELLCGARKILNCDRMSLFVHDPEKVALKLYAENLPDPIFVPLTQGLAAYCFRNKTPVRIEDCYKDFRFDRDLDLRTGYKTTSMIVWPIVPEGSEEAIGVLQAINKLPASIDKVKKKKKKDVVDKAEKPWEQAVKFGKLDENLVEELAFELGISIADRVLDVPSVLGALRHTQTELQMAQADIRTIAPSCFRALVDGMAETLVCDRVCIFVYDPLLEDMMLHASYLPAGKTTRVPLGKGIVGHVFEFKDYVCIEDAHLDSRFDPVVDRRMGYRTKSLVAACIVDPEHDEPLGVVQALNRLPATLDPSTENRHTWAMAFRRKDEDTVKEAAALLGRYLSRGQMEQEDVSSILVRLKYARARAIDAQFAHKRSRSKGTEAPAPPKSGRSPKEVAPPPGGEPLQLPGAMQDMCRICLEQPVQMAVVPCGHAYSCSKCCPKAGTTCQMCGQAVRGGQLLNGQGGGRSLRDGGRANAGDSPSPPARTLSASSRKDVPPALLQ
eukprot:TRINITY_DN3296_c0_g1_i1.p1 TRINITY_DN3296_c0_g1~~TRINITY_DN3296_c0_g1_i1.p1  ORF type:complete len:1291 (-),score=233.61 TRINITY_DN3296_c0_g1_i1:496-4368(-)